MKYIALLFFILVSACSRADVVLHDHQNREIKLSELKGKWVIVNYWADWCGSCTAEIPQLNNFYVHNQDKSVLLFGANYDHLPVDQLKKSIVKRHIVYPVVVEDLDPVWHFGTMEVVPVTFIIGPNGTIKKMMMGAITEKALSKALHDLQK